jgi:heme exporter protein C
MTTDSPTSVSLRFQAFVAVGAVSVALVFAFLSPRDTNQGDLARMFYVHVPSVIVAYTAFLGTMVAAVGFLKTRNLRWDRWAGTLAEVGVVLLGITLVSGMIWAKPVWGVWWTWDARLTLTALLFFVYLGYLGVRRSIVDPEVRAARSAVLGVVAVALIPIVHFSVTWWRTLHQPPTLLRPGEIQMDAPLVFAFIVSMIAFLLVSVALFRARLQLSDVESALYAADATDVEAPLAGDAVSAPSLAGSVGDAAL